MKGIGTGTEVRVGLVSMGYDGEMKVLEAEFDLGADPGSESSGGSNRSVIYSGLSRSSG